MEASLNVKNQKIIIATDDNDYARQVEDVKKTLQPNEQVVVTKSIVAAVVIVETIT